MGKILVSRRNKMEKKRFRFGKAVSFAFKFAFQFPKFIFVPILAEVVATIPYLYLAFRNLNFNQNMDLTTKVLDTPYQFLLNQILINYLMLASAFLSGFVGFLLLAGFMKIVKKWLEKKEEPAWKDFLIADFPLFGKFLAVRFIYVLLIECGIFLLIVPAFVILIIYCFAPYVLIDNQGGVRRSFSRSAELVNGVKWPVFLYYFIVGILVIGPSFYLGFSYSFHHNTHFLPYIYIFSIVTMIFAPIIQLAFIYLYKDLSTQQDEIDIETPSKEEPLPPLPLEI